MKRDWVKEIKNNRTTRAVKQQRLWKWRQTFIFPKRVKYKVKERGALFQSGGIRKPFDLHVTILAGEPGEEWAFNRWYPRSADRCLWTRTPHTAGPSWRCRADRIQVSRSAGCSSSGPPSRASVRRRRRCSRESREAVGGAPRRVPYIVTIASAMHEKVSNWTWSYLSAREQWTNINIILCNNIQWMHCVHALCRLRQCT